MSYDLDFWRYADESMLNDHQAIYERLSDGEHVAGVAEIPIQEVLRRTADVFTELGWNAVDEETWESERGNFQIFSTSQFFRVDCYGMNGDDMNLFIDIASEFGLILYDPQVRERFSD